MLQFNNVGVRTASQHQALLFKSTLTAPRPVAAPLSSEQQRAVQPQTLRNAMLVIKLLCFLSTTTHYWHCHSRRLAVSSHHTMALWTVVKDMLLILASNADMSTTYCSTTSHSTAPRPAKCSCKRRRHL